MKYLESNTQRSIVKAVRMYYPKSLIYAIPNGGFRRKIEAKIMMGEGVLPGVADLHLIHKGKIYFIEVKSERGKQSKYQKDFEDYVKGQGFEYWLVRSVDEVIKLIETK
jgi:hypothetical protein